MAEGVPAGEVEHKDLAVPSELARCLTSADLGGAIVRVDTVSFPRRGKTLAWSGVAAAAQATK